jgi:hypothetical protein
MKKKYIYIIMSLLIAPVSLLEASHGLGDFLAPPAYLAPLPPLTFEPPDNLWEGSSLGEEDEEDVSQGEVLEEGMEEEEGEVTEHSGFVKFVKEEQGTELEDFLASFADDERPNFNVKHLIIENEDLDSDHINLLSWVFPDLTRLEIKGNILSLDLFKDLVTSLPQLRMFLFTTPIKQFDFLENENKDVWINSYALALSRQD